MILNGCIKIESGIDTKLNVKTSISFPKPLGGYVILFISDRSKINMKIWKEYVAIVVIM